MLRSKQPATAVDGPVLLVKIGLSFKAKPKQPSAAVADRAKELATKAVEKIIEPSVPSEERAPAATAANKRATGVSSGSSRSAESEGEMKVAFSRVFTLEVDGRPTLAFEASSTREAQHFCQESWLLNDLSILTSGGVRLRTAKSKLSVRLAFPDEATVFALVANTMKPSDEMVIAYLFDLDGREDLP